MNLMEERRYVMSPFAFLTAASALLSSLQSVSAFRRDVYAAQRLCAIENS